MPMTRRLTETGTEVTITLTEDRFEELLIALGLAIGGLRDKRMQYSVLQLANAINEGNPQFTPYEIPEEYRCENP